MAADLWQALGYDKIALRIARGLAESDDIVVVRGPPGVGKSWLAKGIGAMWQDGVDAAEGAAVVAQGERTARGEALFPFGFAMSGLGTGWGSLVPALTGVARASEVLIGTAGLITTTVEALSKLRTTHRRRRRPPLGAAEQAIVTALERLSAGRPLLLIADDLHWWDAKSLELLARLRLPAMSEAFPFLTNMRVLAVETPEPYQSVTSPAAHEALLRTASTRPFALQRVPRDRFGRVLAALGDGREPSEEVTDHVYACSGGHLALASRCAKRIEEGDIASLMEVAESDDFLHRVLRERIESLGDYGRQALSILRIAAVLGVTFRRDEVVCAIGGDEFETGRLLRYCRDEAVLELTDEVGKFVHDVYRQHFLADQLLDRVGIHETLIRCLRQLRPGDYELRAINAARAERTGEAGALAVQAALQLQREGQPWREMPAEILNAMAAADLEDVAEQFESALSRLNQYRFEDCLEAISGLPSDLPKNLAAEAAYLHATCLIVTRSGEDRTTARAMLEAWAGYEFDEAEVGVRLMQLLFYGYALLVDKSPALKLEGHLRRLLSERSSFDPAAKDARFTLERCSVSIHQRERAVMHARDAVRHFGPNPGQSLVQRPVEYYRCLVNYSSSLLANAQYEEARAAQNELYGLIDSYAAGVFPRLDYAYMNGLQTEYRLGLVSIEQAALRQRTIILDHGVDGDPFYVDNALAVYLTLCGNHGEAMSIFTRLADELTRVREPDPNVAYMVAANRVALRYITGNPAGALEEWHEIAPLIDRISYVTTPYIVRRHELLAIEMDRRTAMAANEFDECLIVDRPLEFGPFWEQLGRGLYLPEIEWWR